MKVKDIIEAAGGPEVTGMYAPTNALLKPEFEPKRSRDFKPKEDEATDETRLNQKEQDMIDSMGAELTVNGNANRDQYVGHNFPASSEKAKLFRRTKIPAIVKAINQ